MTLIYVRVRLAGVDLERFAGFHFSKRTELGLIAIRDPLRTLLVASTRTILRAYVALIVALGAAALVLSTFFQPGFSAGGPVAGLLVFGSVALGLDLAEHRLAMGQAKGSIAFIMYMAVGLAFGPTWAAVIAGTSIAIAQLLQGRPAIKIVFNVSQQVLSLVLATTSYMLLGGAVPLPVSSLGAAILPCLGLVVTYFTINSSVVSAVVSISEGRRFSEVWIRNWQGLVAYDLVASGLGFGIAWLYLEFGLVVILFVVLPIVFLRHTYSVNVQLQATNRELLELMVKAIEARDPYTSGHSQRVSEIARALAREMGLHFRELDDITTAALLHDVGKIYEEFAPILRKEGKLTSEERAIMHTHPIRSAELVTTISNLRGHVENCVRHHHENFDGSGYPEGLVAEEIPMGARIILVADTTDAMTTDRPYRRALTYEKVVQELAKYAGKQFDPRVVAAFKKSAAVRRVVEQDRPAVEQPPLPERERVVQLVAR